MPRPRLGEGEQGARDRLVNAFWGFARDVPVAHITVEMLARKARCNRSTFYYHFDGVADLRARAVDELGLKDVLADEFVALLAGRPVDDAADLYRANAARIDDVCSMTYLNWEELPAWGVPDAVREMWGAASGLDPDRLAPASRIALEFAVGGYLSALAYRGSRGNDFPPEELACVLEREVAPALRRATGMG